MVDIFQLRNRSRSVAPMIFIFYMVYVSCVYIFANENIKHSSEQDTKDEKGDNIILGNYYFHLCQFFVNIFIYFKIDSYL